MKKYIYILFATLLCASCAKEPEQPAVDGNYWPIFNGYMQFSTEVSSRAQLATDMKNKSFGVLGYEYSATADWSGAKSTTAPNAFYNQRVNCDANGVCTYDKDNVAATSGENPKEWGNNRYAFFAYHPYGGSGITLSESTAVNTPQLTYTYGWLGQTDDISVYDSGSPIFDLMTAENIDATGKSSDRVTLDFKHRLFALEVLANNYNENVYEYLVDENGDFILDADGNKQYKLDADGNKIIAQDYYLKDANGNLVQDENGDPILIKCNARQEITNLTLTLSGLAHTSMTIPMSMYEFDNDNKFKYGNNTAVGDRTFKLSDTKVVVPAFNETMEYSDGAKGGEGMATSISKWGSTNGGYLFLIPQAGTNEGIHGTLNWTELANFKAGENEVSTEFTSTIDFEPGRLYQVYINFVGSGITIAIIEAGNWDPHNVTHKFE